MAIELTDDGTMDTVLRCSECGEEMRYNYDGSPDVDPDAPETEQQAAYDAFVESCIEDATADHECASEPTEPEESDLTSTDHETFFQDGHVVLRKSHGNVWAYAANGRDAQSRTYSVLGRFGDDYKAALRAYMDKTQFWPNCWIISDHGNAHLITLSEGKE